MKFSDTESCDLKSDKEIEDDDGFIKMMCLKA